MLSGQDGGKGAGQDTAPRPAHLCLCPSQGGPGSGEDPVLVVPWRVLGFHAPP